jgi:hypothetical protein
MARRPPPSSNGHSTNRFPGAYAHVLHKLCERAHKAMSAVSDYLLLEADEEIEAWERAFAERKAALRRERNGKPLTAQSYMLPRNLPSPFGDGRRCVVVNPNDTITLKPRQGVNDGAA